MGNAKVTDSILESINILLRQGFSQLEYDKTIQATVISCLDETVGRYKVKYQDSFWEAYSENTNTTYSNGQTVYILIPRGDMSEIKTIIGTVKKLGINFLETYMEAYRNLCENLIKKAKTYELSSYKTETKIVYDKEDVDTIGNIDTKNVEEYLKQSSHLKVSMMVKTNIPKKQRIQGNYGIIMNLAFNDINNPGENHEIVKSYVFDINSMTGKPYQFDKAVTQTAVFPIDKDNFKEIKSIQLFVQNFPEQRSDGEQAPADIFISDLKLQGVVLLSQEERNGVSVELIAKDGYIFDQDDADDAEKTIQAQVRIKMKLADAETQGIKFYWFVENASITTKSAFYSRYGGQGWRCLNPYNVIQTKIDPATEVTTITKVQFTPGSATFKIKKSDILTKRMKYKCVAVYQDSFFYRQFNMGNEDAEYTIQLQSSAGELFSGGRGLTDLTCVIKKDNTKIENLDNFIFTWSYTTGTGNYFSVPNTGPVIKNIDANGIIDFRIYKCAVRDKASGVQLGTASITLANDISPEDRYLLVIENGNQVFKYNEAGISPANESKDEPYEIPALTFSIYDYKGNKLQNKVSGIRWSVPSKDTLIEIPDIDHTETDDTYQFININQFNFNIARKYDVSKTNNDIELKLVYNGIELSASTNFTFLKQGENGTNGTNYQVKIVTNSTEQPYFPTITILPGGSLAYNWIFLQDGIPFKVKIWENGVLLHTANKTPKESSIPQYTVKWEVLTTDKREKSFIDINSETGVINKVQTYDENTIGRNINRNPCNIIKATFNYNGQEYYATLPIAIFKITFGQATDRINIVKNSGFKYVTYRTDGSHPSYNDRLPFEIQYVGQKPEEQITYTWSCYGTIKKVSDTETYQETWLQIDTHDDGLKPNQKTIKPKQKYDGSCVSNGIKVIITYTNEDTAEVIGVIYIPIHLMLNRYFNSAINGWDGNSISLNDKGGMILTPQVGAGKKEDDNSFTGVVIGATKMEEDNTTSEKTGLFGFHKGERTIFLDAENGSATFGKAGRGQIIFSPNEGENDAILRSGNYKEKTSEEEGAGMQINLSAPSIDFGNGHFSINKETGTIAGWEFNKTSLSKDGTIFLSSENKKGNVKGSGDITNLRLYFNGNFAVDENGLLYAASAKIGGGTDKITIGQSGEKNSAIYSGQKESLNAAASGFYLGTDGLSIGNDAFSVTSDGDFVARKGYIGNGKQGGVKIGDSGISLGENFSVNSAGTLTAKSGKIANWTITENRLYTDDGQMSIGNTGIRVGKLLVLNPYGDGSDNYTFNISNASIGSGSSLLGGSSGAILSPSIRMGDYAEGMNLNGWTHKIVTDELKATTATITNLTVELQAVVKRLDADFIRTNDLYAKIAGIGTVRINNLTIMNSSGDIRFDNSNNAIGGSLLLFAKRVERRLDDLEARIPAS